MRFELGQHDLSDRFEIPQKLYGREQEINTLVTAFERVNASGEAEMQRGAQMVLVSGPSGVGKSSLINEIHKLMARTGHRGYFIAGKFDQYRRNIPYASLIQAFQNLIRQRCLKVKNKT